MVQARSSPAALPHARGDLSAAAAASAIAALFMGSTLLTPLYGLWQRAYGFSPLTLTLLYAVYVVGNLLALFSIGRLSDQVGRRRMVLAALALAGGSGLVFLLEAGPVWLFLGRAVSGFAVGLGSSAATAWIAELTSGSRRANAAATATAANFIGLVLGPLLAGVLAQYAPWPTRLCFGVYMALLALTAIGVGAAAETVEVRRAGISLKPRIGVPANLRAQFFTPAVMVFVTMAVIGFYAALGPAILRARLHVSNLALGGAVVASLFAAGAVVTWVARRLPSRVSMLCGLGLMPPAVALLAAADAWRAMGLLLLAALTGGVACALGYRGSLQVINAIAPSDRRAEVTSAYLVAAFCGNALPIIGVGVISTLRPGPLASLAFAALIAALALIALAWGLSPAARKTRV